MWCVSVVGTEGLGARSSISGKEHCGCWGKGPWVSASELSPGDRHPRVSGEERGEPADPLRRGNPVAQTVEKIGAPR